VEYKSTKRMSFLWSPALAIIGSQKRVKLDKYMDTHLPCPQVLVLLWWDYFNRLFFAALFLIFFAFIVLIYLQLLGDFAKCLYGRDTFS
jgi:hypothetical protein